MTGRIMERLVGCDLFRRSTHQVELTLAGDALLDRARSLLADLDSALATTRSVGGELVGRANRLWAPFASGTPDGDEDDLAGMRSAYEQMLAQAPPPAEVVVLPLTCGGVPAHGGGFVLGSAYGYRGLAGALAGAIGAGVLVPDYRLAPEHPFPAALDDALSTYLWMIEQGVRPEEVILTGDSGGGGLVMSLLVSLRDLGHSLPAGAVLLCPGVDMGATADGTSPLAQHEGFSTMARVVSWYIGGHPVDDPLIDPLVADLTGLPPLLVQMATGDPVAPGGSAAGRAGRGAGRAGGG
jgi:monoterpene epsilon-lactone hydrolase